MDTAQMDTTAAIDAARDMLEFDRETDAHRIAMLPGHPSGAARSEFEEHDFDTFVETRLRDGTAALYAEAINWMERRLLVRILGETRGNKSKACQILGITRGSLRHKIGQLGIAIHQTVSVCKLDGR